VRLGSRAPPGDSRARRADSGTACERLQDHQRAFPTTNRGWISAAPAVIDCQGLPSPPTSCSGQTAKVERINDDSEARRMWKRFQIGPVLPDGTKRRSFA